MKPTKSTYTFYRLIQLTVWIFSLASLTILLTACSGTIRTSTPTNKAQILTLTSLVPEIGQSDEEVAKSAQVALYETETPSSTISATESAHLAFSEENTSNTPLPSATPEPELVSFAVIGDFGEGNQGEEDVANLVKSWEPDFIITTGDNNYPVGSAETIDDHIGKYYHEFIYPYNGAYGNGADKNRFFPSLGNHDWMTLNAQPYLDYFTLPGNERYYDFVWEPIHFFVVNSDSNEPDGVSRISTQAMWLKSKLEESDSIWKIVYFHHPPYSSGFRGAVDWMRWPFQEWGASAVLSGHDHLYERLLVNGTPFFINGLGGGPIYYFGLTSEYSAIRYSGDCGAMFVEADSQQITFQFINRLGEVIDTYQMTR